MVTLNKEFIKHYHNHLLFGDQPQGTLCFPAWRKTHGAKANDKSRAGFWLLAPFTYYLTKCHSLAKRCNDLSPSLVERFWYASTALMCRWFSLPLPHPQLRKWHRPPTSHSEETPGRPKGKAAKERAPEPPVFPHLSLARASMKIWCISKSDTAIKWRELLVVDEPSPWPVSLITFFGKLLSSIG